MPNIVTISVVGECFLNNFKGTTHNALHPTRPLHRRESEKRTEPFMLKFFLNVKVTNGQL